MHFSGGLRTAGACPKRRIARLPMRRTKSWSAPRRPGRSQPSIGWASFREPTRSRSTFAGAIAHQGFEELPITVEDATRAGALPGPLRDPFDRILIAQALARNLVLISIEDRFDQYGVRRLW